RMSQLHIIPRFIGDGPTRSILAVVARDRRLGRDRQHSVAVLEAPISAPFFMQGRRLGIAFLVRPMPDDLLRAVEATDIVQLHYWNHPALTALLREIVLPPA